MTIRAVWNDTVLAESDDTVIVEGNHYFPKESVNADYLADSDKHTVCPWKGTASYYSVQVGDATNPDAAFYYPTPSKAAQQIERRIAFWRGVEVVES